MIFPMELLLTFSVGLGTTSRSLASLSIATHATNEPCMPTNKRNRQKVTQDVVLSLFPFTPWLNHDDNGS